MPSPHSRMALYADPRIGDPLDLATADLARRDRADDPVGWVRTILGEHIWLKQAEIAESVRDNRRTAVKSCHESGKSWVAGRIAAWWLSTHEPGDAFVVTAAPSFPQVRAILWREINRAHRLGKLPGQVNQTEWWINGEMVAFGRKPADLDPTAFQGIHARYVLVILDEACGVARPLWNAADTLIANDLSRILAIGNPDDAATEFGDVCKPGSGWNVITVSAFDTPNFTGEPIPPRLSDLLIGQTWVEEKRRKWGETSPLWKSKVLGEFPEVSEDTLIPFSWVRAAQDRTLDPTLPTEIGVDVARKGSNLTTIYVRRGQVVRKVEEASRQDTMKTTGRVVIARRETGANIVKVDDVGVGGGVTDRLTELGEPVLPVNVGAAPTSQEAGEKFFNLRAELWWALRDRFESGDVDIDPEDDDLAVELCAVKYTNDSRGRIKVESKEDMQKRGALPDGRSTDHADAVVLAFAFPQDAGALASTPDEEWGTIPPDEYGGSFIPR